MTAVAASAIPPSRGKASRRPGAAGWLALPMALWLLEWSSINSGPWNFGDFGHGLGGTVNAVRAAMPLVVFALAMLALQGRQPRKRGWAEIGMWGYGAAMLAGTGLDRWFDQAYWAFAFLSALAVTELALRSHDQIQAVERLNWLSWSVTTVALVAMLFLAREVLIAPGMENSAYGLINRFQKAHGYVIARETGLSRMAAVPAIISLTMFLSREGWQKVLSAVIFTSSVYVIWIMQSRGALFAFVGAFTFVLVFGHRRGRGTMMMLAFVGSVITFVAVASQGELQELWLHATRDQGVSSFQSMSGRPDLWGKLINRWLSLPLFGYGPQADRLFGVNASNALVYALISGGLIGTICFVAAMLSAWRALFGLLPQASSLPERDRLMFQICGALLVLSSLRSIPENNATVFSVDLLLQYPAMMYLMTLSNWRGSARRALRACRFSG